MADPEAEALHKKDAWKAFDLTGRVALVTGGNGGLGLGMATGLARAGASVVIAGRNETKGAAALADLEQIGAKARFLVTDVTERARCARLVEDAAAAFGRLDILVNNAGMTIRKRPEALTLDDWDLVSETNLASVFVCSKAVHPIMKQQGGGKIINIGSMLSIFGSSFGAAYGSTKGGVVQLTRTLAVA